MATTLKVVLLAFLNSWGLSIQRPIMLVLSALAMKIKLFMVAKLTGRKYSSARDRFTDKSTLSIVFTDIGPIRHCRVA